MIEDRIDTFLPSAALPGQRPCVSRSRPRSLLSILALVLAVVLTWANGSSRAEDAPASPTPAGEATPSSAQSGDPVSGENGAAGDGKTSLDARQDNISRRFKQFEKTLLQMAEYLRKTEPERADLLLRARRKSQEDRVSQQMEQVRELLRSERLGDAVERQGELVKHLRVMLELLQSEDRRSELEKEKERIKNLLNELNNKIARQKDVRAQTERGAEPGPLAGKQRDIAEDTGKLGEKIDRQDAERNGESADQKKNGAGQPSGDKPPDAKQGKDNDKPKDDKNSNKKGGDSEKKDPKQNPSREKKDQEPKAGDPKSGKGQPGSGKPSEGQEGSGEKQGSGGEPQEGQEQQNPAGQPESKKKTPGREEIEQAKKEMEQAIEKLKKLNRDGASGNQDEAVRKLQAAKEKLEEILRQLREEERELMLAALEARFQKMLAQELLVLEGTVGLDKTPKNEWTARHFGRARELAVEQGAIATEAAKALTLLKEEGSSIAFPEGVEQIRDDMISVTHLLEKNEVAALTQGTERDIIESLEEMIDALQKEIEKKKSEQQPPQPGQQGQQQDKPLVEQIAELKMLRSLQLRINRRTKRLGAMVKGEQATDGDVIDQLRELARRQSQVQQATHDLAAGKNK